MHMAVNEDLYSKLFQNFFEEYGYWVKEKKSRRKSPKLIARELQDRYPHRILTFLALTLLACNELCPESKQYAKTCKIMFLFDQATNLMPNATAFEHEIYNQVKKIKQDYINIY